MKGDQYKILKTSDILNNVIGFSNKWLSIFWCGLFFYMSYDVKVSTNEICESLLFSTHAQALMYLI